MSKQQRKRRKVEDDISDLTGELMIKLTQEKDQLDVAKRQFILESQAIQALHQTERKDIDIIKQRLFKVSTDSQTKVKLNIGGSIFMTCIETLTLEKHNYFSALLSDQFNTKPHKDGEYFIDRDPKTFPYILNYLGIQQTRSM